MDPKISDATGHATAMHRDDSVVADLHNIRVDALELEIIAVRDDAHNSIATGDPSAGFAGSRP